MKTVALGTLTSATAAASQKPEDSNAEFQRGGNSLFAFALQAALETDVFVVSKQFQAFKTVHVIIGFAVFARHAAAFAAGHVHVLQVFSGR